MAPPGWPKPDPQSDDDQDLDRHDPLGDWPACETPRSPSFLKPDEPSIADFEQLPSSADVPTANYDSGSQLQDSALKRLRIFHRLFVSFMGLVMGLIIADFMSTDLWKSIRPRNAAWGWFVFINELIVENALSFTLKLAHVVVGFLCDAIHLFTRRGGDACKDLVSMADQAYMDLAMTISVTGRAPALAQDAAAAAFRW